MSVCLPVCPSVCRSIGRRSLNSAPTLKIHKSIARSCARFLVPSLARLLTCSAVGAAFSAMCFSGLSLLRPFFRSITRSFAHLLDSSLARLFKNELSVVLGMRIAGKLRTVDPRKEQNSTRNWILRCLIFEALTPVGPPNFESRGGVGEG